MKDFRSFGEDQGAAAALSSAGVHNIHRLIPRYRPAPKATPVRLEAGIAGLEHRPPRWVEKRLERRVAP
jgi:hypothetical protein